MLSQQNHGIDWSQLVHRLRRWPNINYPLVEWLMFAGKIVESSLVTLIEPGENNLCRVCVFAADMMHAKHTDRTNATRAEHVSIVIDDGPSYLAQA